MRRNAGWKDRLRYALDNSFSRGTGALMGWLGVISFLIILFISLVVWITQLAPPEAGVSDDGIGLLHLLWMGLLRAMDTGTVGGDQGSYAYLAAMMAFTLSGIFILSTLIGLLTSGVEAKIEELRKGRSPVLEHGHILILGWSSKIFTVVSQLCQANAREPKTRIVVLADKDKVEMEDELKARVEEQGKIRIICRTGSPIDVGDLDIVNPDEARTILIMPPDDEDPDAQVVKMILALINNPRRQKKEPYHIVAELHDRKNLEVVRMIGGEEVELIESPGLIARIMVQTSRQSGLSVLYSELLDYGGSEIYFHEDPGLEGLSFGDCLLAYEESTVLGLRRAGGRAQLLPDMKTRVGPGDQLIVIAEDQHSIRMTGLNEEGISRSTFRAPKPAPPRPERTLILGWNRRGPTIVQELDKYVVEGSELTIVSNLGEPGEDIARECPELEHLKVSVLRRDTTERASLNTLDIPSYDHVILLSYRDHLDIQRADARTIISLLHLRDIAERGTKRFSIVGEILDARNRELAEVTRADDFIVSDKLVSLMMAQIAQTKALSAIFTELFDPEGAEIYLKPITDFVSIDRPISFRTLIAAVRDQGQIAIGYRRMREANDAQKAYGVVLGPPKSQEETFSPEDRVIVIAED